MLAIIWPRDLFNSIILERPKQTPACLIVLSESLEFLEEWASSVDELATLYYSSSERVGFEKLIHDLQEARVGSLEWWLAFIRWLIVYSTMHGGLRMLKFRLVSNDGNTIYVLVLATLDSPIAKHKPEKMIDWVRRELRDRRDSVIIDVSTLVKSSTL